MIDLAILTHLWWKLFFIFIGFLGVGFLIAFHEFGHFIFCKIFNIATPSFSVGMGPHLFSKRIGETNFSLSAIPFGGYVEIKTEDDGTGRERSFTQKPYYQKMLVIAGGIFFNIIFAYFSLSLLYFVGMPKSALLHPKTASATIGAVETSSPAEKAGLRVGDTIVSFNGISIENDPTELIKFIKENPESSAQVSIKREGIIEKLDIMIGKREFQDKTIGFLGVDFQVPRYDLLRSITLGIQSTHMIISQVWTTFKSIFAKGTIENIGGPVMVISQTIKAAGQGWKIFLLLLAFISVNLAVLNVIPLPILDGGQALFYTLEAVLRRPLPDYVKIYIGYTCWFIMIALALFLSFKDIQRILFIK
jgi:regulator of sigma E protease